MPCTALPRLPALRSASIVVPAEPRDLGARHVGHDVERLAEDARVGDDRLDAERPQAIAHVRDLRAFGVERADEQDGRHWMWFDGATVPWFGGDRNELMFVIFLEFVLKLMPNGMTKVGNARRFLSPSNLRALETRELLVDLL